MRARLSVYGVTLVEMAISIAVIGIALAGTLEVVRRTTLASADPMIRRQASAIAEAYLEEILLRSYYDPDLGAGGGACPGAEASRALFDNVCDYHGLDDSGPRDQTGTALAGLEPYRVRVTVDGAATLGALSGSASVLRVDVRVSHGLPLDFTLSAYRTQY